MSRLRIAVGLLLIAHGAVHLLGAAAGLGGTEVGLTGISRAAGWCWLAVALVTVAAGAGLIARARWWWPVGAVAAAGSLALVVTHWPQAAAGLLPDLLLVLAAGYGWWRRSARSLPGRYRAATASRPEPETAGPPITADELQRLPAPVARYVRRSGAVGRPPALRVQVALRGRIRGGPGDPWMPFTGEQVNTFGAEPTRYFLLDATRAGLPIDVLHVMTGGTATMEARLLSVLPVVRGAGPELDRGETVTVFNDLCLLAPSALVRAPISWEPIDDRRVRGTYRAGGRQISAVLSFDPDGDLVDFVSDDRPRASADGRTFSPARWSTPVRHARREPHRGVVSAEAHWHTPEGSFSYAELTATWGSPAR